MMSSISHFNSVCRIVPKKSKVLRAAWPTRVGLDSFSLLEKWHQWHLDRTCARPVYNQKTGGFSMLWINAFELKLLSDMNSAEFPENIVQTFSNICLLHVKQQQQVVGSDSFTTTTRGGACRAAGGGTLRINSAVERSAPLENLRTMSRLQCSSESSLSETDSGAEGLFDSSE